MAVILDADVIIRGEKGLFNLPAWLDARSDELFLIAAITIAEVWHGVERAQGRNRSIRERYVRSVFARLPVVPYTAQTAYVHARLWAELKTGGAMIGHYDLIVAATALERDAELATFNKRHFGVVPGLKVIEP